MRCFVGWVWLFALCGVACVHGQPMGPTSGTDGTSTAWTVGPTGVGPVRLNAPFPSELLRRLDQAEPVFGMIADGVVFDGMRFADLGLLVRYSPGSDAETNDKESTLDDEARGARARAWVRQGAPIRSIYVESPGLTTAAGVGVGSTGSDIAKSYPRHGMHPVPPTFGGDRCVVHMDGLPDVYFKFKDCSAARKGAPVVRIELWRDVDKDP